jgi:hypothetical protein
MRSRVSGFGFIALFTGLLLSGKAVAQDSPEFGDDEMGEAEPYEADAAPSEEPTAYEASAPSEPTAAESGGYASSAEEIVADAVPVNAEDEAAKAPGVVLGVEMATFIGGGSEEGSRLTLSPLATAGVAVSDAIQVGVTWGFNFQNNGAPDDLPMANAESAFVVGNPHLWLAHHSQSGRTHFVAGGGITLPAASMPDDAADQAITGEAYAHASAVRGDWNQWLWAPDTASGLVTFAGQAVLDELLIGGEGAAAVVAPTRSSGDLAAVGQAAGEVGYATDDVRVVMRAQVVGTISPVIDDAFQFSIDPYVAWRITSRTTLSARWTINLDQPTGYDSATIWGLRLGANVAL